MIKENTYTDFDKYNSREDLYNYFNTYSIDEVIENSCNNLYHIESDIREVLTK